MPARRLAALGATRGLSTDCRGEEARNAALDLFIGDQAGGDREPSEKAEDGRPESDGGDAGCLDLPRFHGRLVLGVDSV